MIKFLTSMLECYIEFRRDCLFIDAVDGGHVVFMQYAIPRAYFESYRAKRGRFWVNPADFYKSVKDSKGKLVAGVMDNKINFAANNSKWTYTLDAPGELDAPPLGEIGFEAEFTLKSSNIEEILKMSAKYDEMVTFTLKNRKLIASGLSTRGDTYNIIFNVDSDAECISSYGYSVFKIANDGLKISNEVKVAFGNYSPIRITFIDGEAEASMYMAPREYEDEDEEYEE